MTTLSLCANCPRVDNEPMRRSLLPILASALVACGEAEPRTVTVVDLPEAQQAPSVTRLTLAGSDWIISGAALRAEPSEDGVVLHGLGGPISLVSWPASAAFVQRLEEHLAPAAGSSAPEVVHQQDHGEEGFEAVLHTKGAWDVTVLKRRAGYMDGAMCSFTGADVASYKAALAVCASLKPSQRAAD